MLTKNLEPESPLPAELGPPPLELSSPLGPFMDTSTLGTNEEASMMLKMMHSSSPVSQMLRALPMKPGEEQEQHTPQPQQPNHPQHHQPQNQQQQHQYPQKPRQRRSPRNLSPNVSKRPLNGRSPGTLKLTTDAANGGGKGAGKGNGTAATPTTTTTTTTTHKALQIHNSKYKQMHLSFVPTALSARTPPTVSLTASSRHSDGEEKPDAGPVSSKTKGLLGNSKALDTATPAPAAAPPKEPEDLALPDLIHNLKALHELSKKQSPPPTTLLIIPSTAKKESLQPSTVAIRPDTPVQDDDDNNDKHAAKEDHDKEINKAKSKKSKSSSRNKTLMEQLSMVNKIIIVDNSRRRQVPYDPLGPDNQSLISKLTLPDELVYWQRRRREDILMRRRGSESSLSSRGRSATMISERGWEQALRGGGGGSNSSVASSCAGFTTLNASTSVRARRSTSSVRARPGKQDDSDTSQPNCSSVVSAGSMPHARQRHYVSHRATQSVPGGGASVVSASSRRSISSKPYIGRARGMHIVLMIGGKHHRATYSGSIQRGKPNGMGVIKFENDTKDMYIGEMLYGKMHGKGTLTYGGDTVLRGEFFENLYVV